MPAIARRLGKLAPRDDPRTLKLSRYVNRDLLPAYPQQIAWGRRVAEWPMFQNDRIGCCTCASAAHGIRVWTANAFGAPAPITDEDVVRAYSEVSGYDPATGENDDGAVELDVLRHWRKVGIGGHRIGAYTDVDPKNSWLVKSAIYLFGGLYLGISLPRSAQLQRAWSVVDPRLQGASAPGGWGGHAVWAMDADPLGLSVATWGGSVRMSWAFLEAYCDEAHAVLSLDWLAASGKSPPGFNLEQLLADLQAVTS